MISSNPFTSAWDEAENHSQSPVYSEAAYIGHSNTQQYVEGEPSHSLEQSDSGLNLPDRNMANKTVPRFLGIWLCVSAVVIFVLHAIAIEIEGWEDKALEWSSHFFTNELVLYLLLILSGCSILVQNAFQHILLIVVLSSMITIRFPQLICAAMFEVNEHLATEGGQSILDIKKKSEITALIADGAEMLAIVASCILIIASLFRGISRAEIQNQKKQIIICTIISLSAFFMVLPGTTYIGMLSTSMADMGCWKNNPSADILGSFTGISGNSGFAYFTVLIGVTIAYWPQILPDHQTINFFQLFGLMFYFGFLFLGQLMVVINGCYVIHEIHSSMEVKEMGSCVLPFVYSTFAEKVVSFFFICMAGCCIIKWIKRPQPHGS